MSKFGIGAPPTEVNAVLDALKSLGVEHIDMPLAPSRVWNVIRAAGQRPAA
jgi:aerobic carbon-monoxide dehydrogenase large subunit